VSLLGTEFLQTVEILWQTLREFAVVDSSKRDRTTAEWGWIFITLKKEEKKKKKKIRLSIRVCVSDQLGGGDSGEEQTGRGRNRLRVENPGRLGKGIENQSLTTSVSAKECRYALGGVQTKKSGLAAEPVLAHSLKAKGKESKGNNL